MDELSTEYVISTFNKSLSMYGDRPEAVNWTERGQRTRFETMLSFNEDIGGAKILDYGCGKADFYQFLNERGIRVSYTGYDINNNLIALARRKYPECSFQIFDIENRELDEEFDFIYLCGVFNLKISGIVETAQNALIKLMRNCRNTLAFNALSSYENEKDFALQYYNPSGMLDFAVQNLSPDVSLFHNSRPYDFTLFVRKHR